MVEIFMVVVILGLAIGTIFGIAEISSKIWSEGKVASELRSDTRSSLHLLTNEIRESSLATIFLGPASGPPYNAISFGQPQKSSVTGLIVLDSNHNIIWDKTIIYHTYNNPEGGTELRKSVLSWDATLTDVQRQALVDSYVGSPDGRVIIKNLQVGGSGLLNFSTQEFDHWLETDFSNTGIVTDKTVVSNGNVFLDGGGQTWFVGGQTGDDIPDDSNNPGSSSSSSRILIRPEYIFKCGSQVRFKLAASPSGGDSALDITVPSLAETDTTNSRNIIDATRCLLTFSGNNNKTLARGESIWTDWLAWESAVGEVFNKNKAYSLTYYSDTTKTGGSFDVRKWIDGTVPVETQEFLWNGTDASTSPLDWGASGEAQTYLVGLEEIEVSYCASGTLTSQIYNTGVDNPLYDTISWTETLPAGTDIAIKVRSSDNADMSGAPAWSGLTAFTDGTTLNDISGIGTGRYVQFQATLTSSSPYTQTPVLSEVTLIWKGGIITITVDRYYQYRGKGYTVSMTSDAKPKNK